MTSRFLGLRPLENFRKVVNAKGIFDAESSVSGAAQGMQEGSAAQRFAEVAGKGADIGALAAVYENLCLGQACRHARDVDSVGRC